MVEVVRAMPLVRMAERFRHQYLHCLPEQFLASVAKYLLNHAVQKYNPALGIEFEDRIRSTL